MKKFFLLLILICLQPFYAYSQYGTNTVVDSAVLSAEVVITGSVNESGFVHTPLDKINIVNDQIVLSAKLSGLSPYTNLNLWYRQGGSSTYIKINFNPQISDSIQNYSGEAIIPANQVTAKGIEYYIYAEGPDVDPYTFKNSSSPQVVQFVNKVTINYSKNNNVITLKDGNIYDGEASLTINEYSCNGSISFQQIVNVNDLAKNNSANVLYNTPVMAYQIEPLNCYLKDTSLLKLLYMDINQNHKEDYSNIDEEKLKMFWYDGFDWRYMGGNVDTSENIVSASVFTFGIFGLFPISGIDESMYKPFERIITPNSDGINDYLVFNGLSGEFEIKIVDIRGNLIRLITDKSYWDGKDLNGNTVPGGVYFYQLKVNKKIIKGVFINAK